MSHTLQSLYTDFRERFGHFSTYGDDVDPVFLSKRQKIIEDALDGLDEMSIPNPPPMGAQPTLASLKYLHQYILFRCIGKLIHSKSETDSLVEQWCERKFELHNDCTRWRQPILNGQVYEILPNANVKQTLVERFDKNSGSHQLVLSHSCKPE